MLVGLFACLRSQKGGGRGAREQKGRALGRHATRGRGMGAKAERQSRQASGQGISRWAKSGRTRSRRGSSACLGALGAPAVDVQWMDRCTKEGVGL